MHREWYLEGANDPGTWEDQAGCLLNASSVLAREREAVLKHEPEDAAVRLAASMLRPVELMLDGMALECLLKALRLKQGGTFLERIGFRDFAGSRKHDLTLMADALRLKLSPREKDVLDRLTVFVRFAGRYPVPIQASESALRPFREGGGTMSPTSESSGDEAIFQGVVANLKRELRPPRPEEPPAAR